MIPSFMAMMAFQFINCPYKWGGNGPFEFDCSGFVLKVLHEVGVSLPDMTSNDIYKYALRNGEESTEMSVDSLLFFGSHNKIEHIAISLGQMNGVYYMIEAGGAGEDSLRMNKDELAARDARVRIKPISNRRDLVASIKLKNIGGKNENY